MSYQSLYRTYRSQGFDEVLGQRHVTQTLKNALSAGRIAHAYLFTGPRGTGKTSTARILAKALNCLSTDKPTANPCGACEACKRIRDGSSLDVVEIDAASTRSIDDMRELRERVKYSPVQERFKVYIVDEVHQLTGEAFNAFLKTLEEPPANVVFVLATTELHKVPATILSRCQRFDFRRGGMNDLRERIETVCRGEGWSISAEAITALAIGANGGYRDALSLLEQVAAYTTGGGSISLDDVNTVLGSVGDEQLLAAVDAVIDRNAAACFTVVDEAQASGVEVRQFIIGLRRRFRDLLMISVGALPEDAAIVAGQRDRLEIQAKALPTTDALWCIDQLNEAERDLRWAPQQRLLLETALVKLAARDEIAKSAVVTAPVAEAPAKPAARPHPKPPVPDEDYQAPPPRAAAPSVSKPAPAEAARDEVFRPKQEDLAQLADAWQRMVGGMRGAGREATRGMYALRVDNGVLVVAGPTAMWVEKSNESRSRFEDPFSKAYGRRVALKFVHVPTAENEEPKAASPRSKAAAAVPSLLELAAGVLKAEPVSDDPDDLPDPFTE